jgi:glycosyltransferase involved in cell wall biosynthesis
MTILGINASRARSGGAKAHLIGILTEGNPINHGFDKVHIWSYPELLKELPNKPWLLKHSPAELAGSIFRQVWWERYSLPKELRVVKCSILFNVDAGSVCRFKPAVTMSQDMIAFEPGEMKRLGFSKALIRQILLRYIQIQSLKFADGAIFLTRYAANVIQQYSGQLRHLSFIPHGVGENFKTFSSQSMWPETPENQIHCLYVSNTAYYKHQWHVVVAIERLRKIGHNIHLTLTGGGEGKAQKRLDCQINKSDPHNMFIHQKGFVPQRDLPQHIANADLFIFASSCENMPVTLLEAMAIGLPIACSNRGPMPEVLKDGGVYFDPEDPISISKAIEQIVIKSDLRIKLAARAKQLSEQYSWERCAKETFTFLSETATKMSKKYHD